MLYVLITQMIANEQNFPAVLFISDGSNITLCVSLLFLEGLIFGGASLRREICIYKSIGLAL